MDAIQLGQKVQGPCSALMLAVSVDRHPLGYILASARDAVWLLTKIAQSLRARKCLKVEGDRSTPQHSANRCGEVGAADRVDAHLPLSFR